MSPATALAPKIKKVTKQKTAEEPLCRVIIHNDDVTPMDFVIHILIKIFILGYKDAQGVMLTAHFNGQADVQVLPKSEAEKRVNKAHFAAGLEGYPLHFTVERA